MGTPLITSNFRCQATRVGLGDLEEYYSVGKVREGYPGCISSTRGRFGVIGIISVARMLVLCVYNVNSRLD